MRLFDIEFARFAAIGAGVAAFYVVGFAALSAAGMSAYLANTIAFFAATALQYAGQGAFTFRRRLVDVAQAARFVAMTGTGYLVAVAVTAGAGPALGWAPWQAALVVALWLPIQNYVFMKLWVFAYPNNEQEQP